MKTTHKSIQIKYCQISVYSFFKDYILCNDNKIMGLYFMTLWYPNFF